ncbi:transcriptional regulator, MucR family [Mesorhizobium albiziae]|uniref:Transcriptional regulator, MucR family n=1 Tax=Neomesorhizobium albiziae TaxID=335020 RepID=A0A1I3WTK3_9HYPH|nr:MucR family transcriptional regulator [Mesorhizobium albiziae]GLS31878.1 MucR family transcriptional regulator [Mesorhizobium albiziae]SFK10868.1 transcriptional regulator, MucR family [Mesorhizobium albiziae]
MSQHSAVARNVAVAADIVAAYVSHNSVPLPMLTGLIADVHQALLGLRTGHQPTLAPPVPAVPVKRSIHPDYLICLEDGKKFKSLKRHLRSHYEMTPDDYRRKWELPADYPMVAPNYAARRSELARGIGLGQVAAPPPPKPTRKPRAKQVG